MEDEDDKPGSPAWLATFADLMSLLMCFFVLLLSISEIDARRFKQIAGSLSLAFGVQTQTALEDIPKGTSIIALEFSPGETTDTPIDTIQQITDDTLDQSLRVGEEDLTESEVEALLNEKIELLLEETRSDAEKLGVMLEEEVSAGKVDVISEGRTITIRIREQGSFPSGSAVLNPQFKPALARIRTALADIEGTLSIEGHTDNVPIRGTRYESNWALSTERALSVTHELLAGDMLDSDRFMVVGYAESRPFTANDTADGRAANRRVEIVLRQGLDAAQESELDSLRALNPDAVKLLGVE